MPPVILPPVSLTRGFDFSQNYRIETPFEEEPILDLTGWTARASVSVKPFDPPFWTGALAIEDDRIVFAIPGADSAGWDAVPVLGGKANAVFQIVLAPVSAPEIVWQGNMIIAGTLE